MCTPTLPPCLALRFDAVATHHAEFIAAIEEAMHGQ